MKIMLRSLLNNPCGYESSRYESITKNKLDIAGIKDLLTTIESSSKTGLSDFKERILGKFLQNSFNKSVAMKDDHHNKWKHRSNPNLHPNETQLEIDFSKDLYEAKRNSTTRAARNFNFESKQQLLELLYNCDDRLQRLLVIFYGMINNLDDFTINSLNEYDTEMARENYADATNIIHLRLCDVHYIINQLLIPEGDDSETENELDEFGYKASEINNLSQVIDVEKIYSNLPKADSIGDWVNMRQLHDQLKYMSQVFSIWANEINVNDPI